jgi:hypothetical protein
MYNHHRGTQLVLLDAENKQYSQFASFLRGAERQMFGVSVLCKQYTISDVNIQQHD